MIDTGIKMIANWYKHKSFVNLQPETLVMEFTPHEFSSMSISRLDGHKLAVASSPKLRHGTAWVVDRPTTMGCCSATWWLQAPVKSLGKNLTIRCGGLDFLQLFIWIYPKYCSGDLRYSIYEFFLGCSGIFAAFLNRSATPKVESNHNDIIPPSLFCLTKSIQVQLRIIIITTTKQQR